MPIIYSHREYADMIFVYGFCNGNSVKAVAEYHRRFTNRTIPNRTAFQRIFSTAQETGTFPSVKIISERPQGLDVDIEENILDIVTENPSESSRRIANQLQIRSHKAVWETLKRNSLKPFHLQPVQHLQEADPPLRIRLL